MITVKEIDKSFLELYDKVAMNVDVQSEYHVKRINNGLGGLILEEVKVKPYIKDLSIYERAAEYEKEFDITNWRFYMAFDGNVCFAISKEKLKPFNFVRDANGKTTGTKQLINLDKDKEYIEKLDNFIHDKNANVKSCYETMLKWYDQDRMMKGKRGKYGP